MLIQIAICEDETYMLNDIKIKINEYLKKVEIEARIFSFNSGIALIHSNEYFDIIIMDIKMSELNGMETVRLLRKDGINSQVIFVTSSNEYVFQAFDVDAVHYLMKPVSNKDLFRALDKAVKHTEEVDKQSITITKGGLVRIIHFRDIVYCEAIDHKIYICTSNSKVDYYGKLDTLQEELDKRFFRCHRSYIVNMNYVSGREKDFIIMTNGDRIFLSRRRQRLFSEKLLLLIRSEVL